MFNFSKEKKSLSQAGTGDPSLAKASDDNHQSPELEKVNELAEQNDFEAPAEKIQDSDIHVMPKKSDYQRKPRHFKKSKDKHKETNSGSKPKKPHKINWIFLGILMFVVFGSLITVIIIFYTVSYRNQQVESNENINQNINQVNPTLNQNVNTSNTNTQNTNQNTNTEPSTALERDQQRIDDMLNLSAVLDLYFAQANEYPGSLSELLVDYMDNIPTNPNPGGKTYNYAAIEENSSYQILFSLEQGALYGTLNLTQGDYQTTPSGITLVMIPPANQNQNTSPFPPIMPSIPQTASDVDNDYLTDIEENFYQTDPENADTDEDSYLDGVEVRNLYSPLEAEIKLVETDLIEVFTNESYNYTIFYPKEWVANALASDYKEVLFVSSMGEFVSVLIQDNPLGLSAMEWYLSHLPNTNIDANALETLEVSGLPAVKSLDGLNTYLSIGNTIYGINYNIGNNQEKIFETTYKMMLASFVLTNLNN